MKITSAYANKLVKRCNEDLTLLYKHESQLSTYTEVDGVKCVPPEYFLKEYRSKIAELQDKICKLKHALNVFNTTTFISVDGKDITIDTALIRMAMLTKEKDRLSSMQLAQERELIQGFGARQGVIEYRVANYNLREAEACYKSICDQLTELQTQLDYINNTATFTVDI